MRVLQIRPAVLALHTAEISLLIVGAIRGHDIDSPIRSIAVHIAISVHVEKQRFA